MTFLTTFKSENMADNHQRQHDWRNFVICEEEVTNTTATTNGVPEGLPEATNSIQVLRKMAQLTAAEERDQWEAFSNRDRGAKRGTISLTTVTVGRLKYRVGL